MSTTTISKAEILNFIKCEIGLKTFFIYEREDGLFAIYKAKTSKKPIYYIEVLKDGVFNYFQS